MSKTDWETKMSIGEHVPLAKRCEQERAVEETRRCRRATMSKDAQIAKLREALYYMLYPDEMPCSDLAKDKAQSLAQPLEHAWAEYVLAATGQEEQ